MCAPRARLVPLFFVGTSSNGFISNNYRLMASSLVKMGAADGEVNIDAFAFDIERVMERLGSMEAQVDTNAVIDEDTGRVSYGTSVNVDQEVSGVGRWIVKVDESGCTWGRRSSLVCGVGGRRW